MFHRSYFFAPLDDSPQSLHTEVLDPLHVLLAIALELPEDYFINLHKYEHKSEVRPFHSSVASAANLR